jgi:glucan biosynthesis protein C
VIQGRDGEGRLDRPSRSIDDLQSSRASKDVMADGSPAPERLHALDAVRGFALLLGIVLHATLSFLPAPPTRIWIIQDSHPSMALAVLFFVIHVFRMTTFFLIAGFFAHMSFHRRGGRAFIKDRLQRIALPLVVGWPILFAAMVVVIFWAANFPNGGPVPGAQGWPPELPRFPLTHLWFLYVLLELYVATLVLRTAMAWLDKSGHIRAQVDRLIGLAMRSPLAPAILAFPIGIALNLDPTWFGWLGVRTPDQSLVTNVQAAVGFGTAFGFGWVLHRQIDLIWILERRWLLNLVFASGLIAASIVLASVPGPRPYAVRFADATCYALAMWTTTFVVIGIALRFFSDFSATRRYIADASYWLYLIHLPIVMALQVAVFSLDWPWPAKFATILLVAVTVMFVSYQFLVRYSVIGAALNGRRIRKPSEAADLIRSQS